VALAAAFELVLVLRDFDDDDLGEVPAAPVPAEAAEVFVFLAAGVDEDFFEDDEGGGGV